jgi:energy-coupling factor transport system permease protein
LPMLETAFFRYRPGRSLVHRLDPRLKIALAALATAAAASAGPVGLTVLTALLCALFAAAGFAPALGRGSTPGVLRALLPLSLMIVLGRGFGDTEGPRWLAFSLPGLLSGLLYAWRLAVMALSGSLLVASTTSGALRAALAWILSPLPRRVGARTATMAGIMMASLPLLAREISEVKLARAARLADRARPLSRRMVSMARPFVYKTLLRADTLSAAMEARCYSYAACAVTAAPLTTPDAGQWAAFFACALIMAGIILFLPR